MPRYQVWVSQLSTLEVPVQAETAHEAEAQVRARLRDSPNTQAWLDSATIMRSGIGDAAPNAAPRREITAFPTTQQLLNTTDAGKYLSISRTKMYAAEEAGLTPLSPHELRHTAASLAVALGANVKAVQRMLGHASAAMTLDTYSGLFEDDLDDVAARLDSAAMRSNTKDQASRAR